jgi:NACalpha-BTF3-like transcription factor
MEKQYYKTFDDFVKEYFNENNIEFNDLNNIDDKTFVQKYKTTKNELHSRCVEQYKTKYPNDYEEHIKKYREKQQKILEERKKYQQEYINNKKKEFVDILMRQTDYDKEKAIEELEKYNYNVSLAVKNYLIPNKEIDDHSVKANTTNQKIFKEIRDFMDTSNLMYEQRKEYSKKITQEQNFK